MTDIEKSAYKAKLFEMSDNDLETETVAAINQAVCMPIQLCYNEWSNRGKGERFVQAYNKSVR